MLPPSMIAGEKEKKPMPNEADLEKARQAYEHAWGESKKYGDEALDALQNADLVSSQEARDLFKRKAGRALTASENWRKAAELMQEVMQEIASGIPRGEQPSLMRPLYSPHAGSKACKRTFLVA